MEKIFKPKDWSEVTIEQFSEYNKDLVEFKEKTEALNLDDENDCNQILIEEVNLNFKICAHFSRLPEEEVYALDIAFVKDYVESLDFITEKYEPNSIKSFTFDGVKYNIPDNLRISTKFGQYIEALQSEMNTRFTDKNSVIYLAHQLAHIVDNGEDWNAEYRDELAEKFKKIPMSIAYDFAFFLLKKCQIYSLAFLKYHRQEELKRLPFTKRFLSRMDGLKHYMSWQNLKYLRDLIRIRLTVFYILLREKFLHIYHLLPQGQFMTTK